jgi:DNA polymerase elongation subunit (family B)/rubredoxin
LRILVLDIEISPTVATIWGLFNQNINIQNIIGNSEVLCWSAKWLGEEVNWFSSIHMTTKRAMLKEIYDMLQEADAVVTYNGKSFDLKILNKEFALMGWARPSPYKNIDILQVMRTQFRFTSNKLGYIGPMFGLGGKTKHPGHDLWLNCMNPRSDAYESSWEIMEEYNRQDVELLEALYIRLKGWVPNHPSHSALQNDHVCPNCGGVHLQKRGTAITTTLSYQRWQCRDCGAWSRSKVANKANRSKQLVGIK